MLRLHDTAIGTDVPLEPGTPGAVSMYVCGPTVYGLPHLGHGRFSLVFDILRRYLEWSGLRVRYVSNITDIDDKIIIRAHEEARSTEDVAREYEAAWWDAMDGIGVKRPDENPHATAYVDHMIELVSRLVESGFAYETSDGVYFHAAKVPDYGLLARQSIDSLRAGARVDTREEKQDPADFALWKKAKPGEPEWPSPWGPGRPGWHTECVVMSLDLLGDGFDVHGGGQDLAFPHHENERAQAVAIGRRFARRWVHNGWVVDERGDKMSKSLGNFTNLTELLTQLNGDGRPYRLLCLQSHYRSPVTVTGETIDVARAGVARLDEFARRFPVPQPSAPRLDEAAIRRFTEAMDDDLNTPVAMAVLFELVTEANAAADANDPDRATAAAATVHHLAGAVGLELGRRDEDVPEDVQQLVAERDSARAAKDWAQSDALRDRLSNMGWVVKDTPSGTVVHR